VDLPGLLLGAADRSVIYLDSNAAGYGWYADARPEEHDEFTRTAAKSFRAPSTSPAAGRMDLLTVLTHELGHLLGLEDLDPVQAADDIMAGVLQPGVRRLPWPAAVDAVFFGQG
jgi:hypothetical protein